MRTGAARASGRHRRGRRAARDGAAAEHARPRAVAVVDHAGLAGRDAVLGAVQLDLRPARSQAERRRARLAGRAHAHRDRNLSIARERRVAEPVEVRERHRAGRERGAWADHDLGLARVEADDVKRFADGEPEPAPLPDRVMDDAAVAAEHAAVEVDDVAGARRPGLQPLDDLAVMALRYEADVLAVGLVGDAEPELPGEPARLGLAELAEREAQHLELLARRGVEEIALVALRIGGAEQGAAASRQRAARDVVPGREQVGGKLARRREQVAELD